jgi:hypothetical protein
MSRHILRGATIAALALGAGVTALAQQQGEFTQLRTPGWSFTPSVTIGGVFDSNVAIASAPASTRRTESDQLWTLEPGGHLEFISPRTELGAGYRGFVRRYLDVSQLNGFDQRGYLSLRRLATKRLTFFLRDSYMDVPTTDEVELNGIPFARVGSRTNSFAGGVEAKLTRFTSLAARYDLTWVDFDRNTDSLLTGGWVNGLRTEVSHRLNPRASLGGEYAVRLADMNEGTRSLTFHDVGATFGYALGPATSLSLAGGMSYLLDRTLDETRTGPYVRAGITHQTERATFGASFQRQFVPSFGFGGSSDSQELSAYVRMPVYRNRAYVQGSASWRRSDPFVASELELDTIWLRSTAGYAVARWLRVESYYAFTRQDSKVTGGEINRHRAGAQVVISQPMRIR